MIACLDVRANDKGDLVVTKGDQYDVRETTGENEVYFCYLYFYFSLLLVCEGRYMYKKKKIVGIIPVFTNIMNLMCCWNFGYMLT